MRAFILFIAQLLIAVSGIAQVQKYTSSNLNMRSSRSSSSEILTTIPLRTPLTILEDCDCAWIKVSYNGITGFVKSTYLTNTNKTANTPTSAVKYYTNTAGERVQSPTHYRSVPSGATALCRDGTYSFSRNRRGTCSRHGGVAKWL